MLVIRVNSSPAGAIIATMPRRRSYLERPAGHLAAAAAAHAAIVAGEPHPDELAEGERPEPEPSPSQRQARKQPRTEEGKFA